MNFKQKDICLHTGQAVSLSQTDLEEAIRHANQMADAAGAAIMPYFRSFGRIENKLADAGDDLEHLFDPVTLADRAGEQAILDVLASTRPDDSVLGEESGFKQGRSGLCWVLDPIDGTRGFVCGLSSWGTLIALYDGSSSVVGLMDQPVLKERFIGSAAGAVMIDQSGTHKLSVSGKSNLREAFLCTTSPDLFKEAHSKVLASLTGAVAMTRYGTDCYGYAMLAAGMVDAVVEPGLQSYDIQALIPIVTSAGGVISDWQGEPLVEGGNVVASASPELHEQILHCISNACV